MSTAIKDFDLSGQTVRYGNCQFGSGGPLISGTTVKCTPPQFSLRSEARYDDAGRVVVAHRCNLDVRAVLFNETTALQEAQLRAVRRELLTPRKAIYLDGLGLGIGDGIPSVDWGPMPISCVITTHGTQTAELSWSVQFEIACCDVSQGLFSEFFKSFNYAQAYSIDDEGLLTRVTSGYWEIAPQLPGNQYQVADNFREQVNIAVPTGFRRVQQNYSESPEKSRMDFQIVDVQLRGDALPPFMTHASGNFSLGVANRNFSQGLMSLNASITVAPGQPPSLAMLQFFLMSNQKIEDIRDSVGNQMQVIPLSLSIERGLWEESRTTRFAATWQVASCISEFLQTGLWSPLPNSDYEQWAQSIGYTWHQRGVAGVGSDVESDIQASLCNATSEAVINVASDPPEEDNTPEGEALLCPEVDPEYSWLHYEANIKFQKTENRTWHKLAADFNKTVTNITDGIFGVDGIKTGEQFDPTGKSDIAEDSGSPTQLILLEARGLRVQHKPTFPALSTFGGQPVELIKEQFEIGPAFNVGCPVYKMRGWRLYRVVGNVGTIDQIQPNPVICEAGDEEEEETP